MIIIRNDLPHVAVFKFRDEFVQIEDSKTMTLALKDLEFIDSLNLILKLKCGVIKIKGAY
jgi:hypothetical protein